MKCSTDIYAKTEQKLKICQLSKHLLSIVLKSGIKIKPNQNALSGFKLMPHDSLPHIYYKIHVCMFPLVATRDSKQYLQQLMIPESIKMGVYRKGAGVVLQVTKARYLMSVKTGNNGVPVSRQCFSYKYHVSNIDFQESPFRNPYCHQQLHL